MSKETKEMVVEPVSKYDMTGKLHLMFQGICPHCSKTHTHSAELGHRQAHCNDGKFNDYELVLRKTA